MPDNLDHGDVAELFALDPDKSSVVAAFGRKGTGKSYLSTMLFEAYPYDRLLIDNTGDVDPGFSFTSPWPYPEDQWPDPPEQGQRGSWRLRPNHRTPPEKRGATTAPQWRWDIDDALGFAMDHGRVAVQVDEVGETFPVGKTLPMGDDMLHTLRHRNVSLFAAGPRPVGLDPLVLTQADLVAMFNLPHEIDVRRLAATLGLPDDELYGLIRGLDAEAHEFLLFDQNHHELYHCDPLP